MQTENPGCQCPGEEREYTADEEEKEDAAICRDEHRGTAGAQKAASAQYKEFQGKDLRLDMSRGKPSVEQLDLSMGMMDVLSSSDDLTCEDGTDCRNYGA